MSNPADLVKTFLKNRGKTYPDLQDQPFSTKSMINIPIPGN